MIAVLDANVLFPQYLCDLMLSLAETELFQPRWSDFIHDEWMRNLFKTFPELEISRIKRRREMMDRAFPDASVSFAVSSDKIPLDETGYGQLRPVRGVPPESVPRFPPQLLRTRTR